GWHRRGARRSSSNSCDPAPRPFPTSARQHGAVVHTARIAARSGRSPPRTPSTTDQGLRCEPRRPRRIQLSSQTPNDAAVTAPTSADTPKRRTSRSTAAVLVASGFDELVSKPNWVRKDRLVASRHLDQPERSEPA